MGSPLDELSVPQMGLGLRRSEFTALDLATAALERIDRVDPSLHAFVAVTRDRALDEARAADRELADGRDRGPLHGIPYAVKDLFDVAGLATTGHSRLLLDNVASKDAEVVAKLRRAGAVLVGKLATYELAIEPWPGGDGPFPAARNPRDITRITGGSSSGSASAVAAGLVRFALGTDTGGSIRSPAAYCGVVGLKPGFGRVSMEGVLPLSPSLDHAGPLAATVEDAAFVLDAIATTATGAAGVVGFGVEGLRIAYARDFFAGDAPAEISEALDAAARQLCILGAEVVEVDLPPYAIFEDCGRVLLQAEAYALHAQTLRTRSDKYGTLAFASLAAGAVISASDLLAAQHVQHQLRDEVDNGVFARFDAILTGNVLATAERTDAGVEPGRGWTPMRTFPFNVTGHPALALPMGLAEDGMPIGLQLVAPAGGEAMLCRIGAALERDFAQRPVTARASLPGAMA